MKSRSKTLLAGAAVLVIAVAAFLLFRPNPPVPPYPVPNGYDDLVKAAAAVQQLPGQSGPLEPNKLTAEERQWLVESNRAALLLLRQGLAKEIKVVLTNDSLLGQQLQYLASAKMLSQLLTAEAEFAAASSNQSALLTACFDNYALGCRGLGGGRIVEGLVSLAIRHMAIGSMEHIPRLGDAVLCRQAALRLHTAMTNAPSAQPYLDGEAAWERTLPFTTRFHPAILWQKLNGTTSALPSLVLTKFTLIRQREAETVRDLAAAAFRLEHGRTATNWTELVPEYLPEVARNATNNAPLPLGLP